MKKKLWLMVLILTIFSGCVAYQAEDGTTRYKLSLKAGEQIEKGGETVLNLLTIFAPLLGPMGMIAVGGVASGVTVFKKMKPRLTMAQDKYELTNTVATIVVEAIEQIKKDHPKMWETMAEKLQKECEESGIDTRVVKNCIRNLRGLPMKA